MLNWYQNWRIWIALVVAILVGLLVGNFWPFGGDTTPPPPTADTGVATADTTPPPTADTGVATADTTPPPTADTGVATADTTPPPTADTGVATADTTSPPTADTGGDAMLATAADVAPDVPGVDAAVPNLGMACTSFSECGTGLICHLGKCRRQVQPLSATTDADGDGIPDRFDPNPITADPPGTQPLATPRPVVPALAPDAGIAPDVPPPPPAATSTPPVVQPPVVPQTPAAPAEPQVSPTAPAQQPVPPVVAAPTPPPVVQQQPAPTCPPPAGTPMPSWTKSQLPSGQPCEQTCYTVLEPQMRCYNAFFISLGAPTVQELQANVWRDCQAECSR